MWRLNNTVSPELKELSNAGQPALALTDLSSGAKAYEKMQTPRFASRREKQFLPSPCERVRVPLRTPVSGPEPELGRFKDSYSSYRPGRCRIGLRPRLTIREGETEGCLGATCTRRVKAQSAEPSWVKDIVFNSSPTKKKKKSHVTSLRLQSSKGTLNFMHTYGSVDSEWLLTCTRSKIPMWS